MRCTDLLCSRHTAGGLIALLAIACTDSPTSVVTPLSDRPLLAVTGKPPLDQTLEGEGWVCKDGAGPATNFTFAVSIDGGAATNHVIALGTCAQVASFPVTPGQQFFHNVSVTETVPANWNISSIIVESNAGNPAVTYQPVINSPNASARLSHDWGIVFTFTNAFTPPGPSCTATQGFWKNHPELWDAVADGKPFLTTSTFYNSGVSYLTIMTTPPAKGNAYLQLAHQFIAASLNVNGGSSGVSGVDAALAGAAAYFAGAPAGIPNPVDPTRSQLQAWATTLDDFNNGRTGPGHCPD
jgi:hypothetical protein